MHVQSAPQHSTCVYFVMFPLHSRRYRRRCRRENNTTTAATTTTPPVLLQQQRKPHTPRLSGRFRSLLLYPFLLASCCRGVVLYRTLQYQSVLVYDNYFFQSCKRVTAGTENPTVSNPAVSVCISVW